MSGRGKGGSYPGGRKDRQSEKKKGSEKRKHSGNNHSGLTPTNKAPVQQDPRGTLGSPLEVAPSTTGNGGPGASSNIEPRKEEKTNLGLSDRKATASPVPSETSSVTTRMEKTTFDEEETRKLLAEEDVELEDFTPDQEEDIARTAMEGVEDGDASDKPPKTYAKAAEPAPAIRGFEVIYVHYGNTERAPLTEALFYKLWDRINTITIDMMLNGEEVPDGMCLWKKWKQDRGLM